MRASNLRVVTPDHVTKMAATQFDPPYSREKPMLHANVTAVCVIEAELSAIEFSICGDRIASLSNAVLLYIVEIRSVDLFLLL